MMLRGWLSKCERLAWAVLIAISLLIIDYSDSLPSICIQCEQQKDAKSAEKGKPFGEMLIVRMFNTFIDFIDKRHDFVTAAATVVIAAFTITLWRSTHLLWKAGDITAQRQLRAYVRIVVDPTRNIEIDNGTAPQMFVLVENVGQTPAHDLTVEAVIEFGDFPLTEPLPPFSINETNSKVVVHPKSSFRFLGHMNRVPHKDEVQAVMNGFPGRRIYLYGRVDYKDEFGCSRWTTFRLIDSREVPGMHGFSACHEGNEAF